MLFGSGTYFDRDDKVWRVKERASRIYRTTIAANEREERNLRRETGVLNRQQLYQSSKMQRLISRTNRNMENKLKQMHSVVRYAEESTEVKAKAAEQKCRRDNAEDLARKPAAKSRSFMGQRRRNARILPKIEKTCKEAAKERAEQAKSICKESGLLGHSVKYTEAEVHHLKVSFVGKRGQESRTRRSGALLSEMDEDQLLTIERRRRKWKRLRTKKKKSQQMTRMVIDKLNDLNLEKLKIE